MVNSNKSALPLVSVVVISYNQEKFIEQSLRSIFQQKTDFVFEVIIADDCSTDSTQSIIKRVVAEYEDRAVLVLRKKNVGVQENLIGAMRLARGKYIALCEGDDYWTNESKLQKQADFLERNQNYSVCFHLANVIFEGVATKKQTFYPENLNKTELTIDGLLRRNYIQTNSVMYRKVSYANMPLDILPLDWYLHVYHAKHGKIGFINEAYSAYRRHPGGIWWDSHNDIDNIWIKYGIEHLTLYAEMLKLYGDTLRYSTIINRHIFQMLSTLRRIDSKHETNMISKAVSKFPEIVAGFVVADYENHTNEVRKLKKHMDEQAKIISYLDEKAKVFEARVANLENQNKHLVRTLGTRATAKLKHAIKKS